MKMNKLISVACGLGTLALASINQFRRFGAVVIIAWGIGAAPVALHATLLTISDPNFDNGAQSPTWTSPRGGGSDAPMFTESRAISAPFLMGMSAPGQTGRSQATPHQFAEGIYSFSVWTFAGAGNDSLLRLQLYTNSTPTIAGSQVVASQDFVSNNDGADAPVQTVSTANWEQKTLVYSPPPSVWGQFIILNIEAAGGVGFPNADNVTLDFVAIPEPTAALLLAFSGMVLFWRTRRG